MGEIGSQRHTLNRDDSLDRLAIRRRSDERLGRSSGLRAGVGGLFDSVLHGPGPSVGRVHLEIALFNSIGGGVFLGDAVEASVDGHHLVNVVLGAERGLILGENLGGPARADLAGNGAGVGANLHFDDRRRPDEVAHRGTG
jgi:hypothetical protein